MATIKVNLSNCPNTKYLTENPAKPNFWFGLDKYGDDSSFEAGGLAVLKMFVDGTATTLPPSELSFERKIEWPRVFRTPATTLVAVSATQKLIEIGSDFKLYDFNTMESQAWINEYGKRNVEVFGEERDRALKVYNALS